MHLAKRLCTIHLLLLFLLIHDSTSLIQFSNFNIRSMLISSNNKYFIGDHPYGIENSKAVIIKTDNVGTTIWRKEIESVFVVDDLYFVGAHGVSIAVDPSNNVYATISHKDVYEGYNQGGSREQLYKIGPDGRTTWVIELPIYEHFVIGGIVNSNLYLIGITQFMIVSPSGVVLKQKLITADEPESNGYHWIIELQHRERFLRGEFAKTNSGGLSCIIFEVLPGLSEVHFDALPVITVPESNEFFVLLQLDSQGKARWGHGFELDSPYYKRDVSIDSEGNCWFVTGDTLRKYSPNGQLLFSKSYTGYIALDNTGKAYIADDVYPQITMLNTNGLVDWQFHASYSTSPTDLFVRDRESIYLAMFNSMIKLRANTRAGCQNCLASTKLCCYTSANGPQCYDPKVQWCTGTESYFRLCPLKQIVCGTKCFSPETHFCDKGIIKPL
jgi:hypothetical protein